MGTINAKHSTVKAAVSTLILLTMPSVLTHAQTAKKYETVNLVGTLSFTTEFALEVRHPTDPRISGECLSGYFLPPDKQQEYMASLNGKVAEVSGKLVRYADLPANNPLSDTRRRISNRCGGEYVLIGQSAREYDGK